MNKKTYLISLALSITLSVFSQEKDWNDPQTGNPVVPGYFADPCLVDFDGKYHIYSTTVSKFMEPMVWTSEDLQSWEVHSLGITGDHLFWAPSVLKGDDGKIYLYYSSGYDYKCHLYVGETATGPWEDKGMVEEGFDLEIFRDPVSGKVYGSSSNPSSRPRLVEFQSDVKKEGYLTKVVKEANLEGPFFDYTEGSYIVYRDGWYYFMYSGGKCHAENYKINYARSKNIWGPYEDAPNNPILEKINQKNIFGPGHHSVFNLKDQYFIAYHRQDVYEYPTCSERHLCIDKMNFDDNGWIKSVTPTHEGVDFSTFIESNKPKLKNVAYGKPVTSGDVKESHNPELAVDENYATYWIGSGYFSVDLGKDYDIEKIVPRFMNYDYHLLYKIMYSDDNTNWNLYYDQTRFAQKAATEIKHKPVTARYVKIEFIRGEGPIALSELKVFAKDK